MLLTLLAPYGARKRIAESIGVNPSLVTRWGQGRQSPVTRYRVALEREHGIPVMAWDEPAETAATPPSAA